MMKSASFLQELHRTYKRIKGGHSGRTDLCKVDYLVDNIEEGGGSNSRIETYENIESKVRRYHGKFRAGSNRWMPETGPKKGFKAMGISIVSDTRIDDLSKGGS